MGQASPIASNERIVALDVMRGVALFGILMVNMAMFHTPVHADLLNQPVEQGVHRWVGNLVAWLFEGKFYTMFSFLFGYGFMLFMARQAARVGERASGFFIRRLLVLLLIGVAHAILLWWGDILMLYALTGLLLLGFYRAKVKTLLIWVLALWTSVVGLIALVVQLSGLMPMSDTERAAIISELQMRLEQAYVAYSGDFSSALSQRISDLGYMSGSLIISALFLVLPMFLLGMAVARLQWIAKPAQAPLKAIWWVSLVLAVVFTALKVWSESRVDVSASSIYDVWQMLGTVIGDPAGSVCYMTSILLIVRAGANGWLVRSLAATGRMALTNYLLQTLICTTLFYGYGFGLYGNVSAGTGLLIVLAVYTVQVMLSRWWMGRFAYGPMERLWRLGTYGRTALRDKAGSA